MTFIASNASPSMAVEMCLPGSAIKITRRSMLSGLQALELCKNVTDCKASSDSLQLTVEPLPISTYGPIWISPRHLLCSLYLGAVVQRYRNINIDLLA